MEIKKFKTIWIDGPFITDKPDPNDIDGCWEYINSVDLNVLDKVFSDRGSREKAKEKYGLDFEYILGPIDLEKFKDFFQDYNNEVAFIDNKKIIVAGKVVGGSVEAAKPVGFGHQGLVQTQIGVDVANNPIMINVSSKNNIGEAEIVLGYTPPPIEGSTSSVTEQTKFKFKTNTDTGEYRVEALPLNYGIQQVGGITITNNFDGIQLPKSN